MEPSWAPGLKALVRRHRYDFAAAAAEVGATAKELRVELARQEFGGAAAPPNSCRDSSIRSSLAVAPTSAAAAAKS